MSITRRSFNAYVKREAAKGAEVYNFNSTEDVIRYAKAAYDLVGQRVAIHTNRNEHVWSIKTPDSKHRLLAYAFNKVLLKDVCWTQPSVSAARSTFHNTLGGQRNVQAFAEGVLIGCDILIDEDALDLDLPALPLMYRPKPVPGLVGAFRSVQDPSVGVASSEFGILEYTTPLGENTKRPGSRRVSCIAFGDIQTIPEGHLSAYVDTITDPGAPTNRMRRYVSPNCRTYRKR
jgi:hypothetical protein